MPFLALGAIAFALVFIVKQKAIAASVDVTPKASGGTPGNPPAAGGLPDPNAKDAASAAGTSSGSVPTVIAVVAAATGGAIIGHEVAHAVGQETGSAADIEATVGGGVAAAVAVLAYLAPTIVAPPVAIIVFAAVVAIFIGILLVDDIETLNYGQEGVRHDYEDAWQKLYDKCFKKLRALPKYAGTTDKQLARILIPYVDGYSECVNTVKFRHWSHFGVALGHISTNPQTVWDYGAARGKFITAEKPGSGGNEFNYNFDSKLKVNIPVFPENDLFHSSRRDFILSYLEPPEQITTDVVTIRKAIPPAETWDATEYVGGAKGTIAIILKHKSETVEPGDVVIHTPVLNASIAANSKTAELRNQGFHLCNLGLYLAYMTRGSSDEEFEAKPDQRVRNGIERGFFLGTPGAAGSNGSLVYEGATINWVDLRSLMKANA